MIGVRTVAEWVESAALAAELSAVGIDYAQDYDIAKPAPLQALLGAGLERPAKDFCSRHSVSTALAGGRRDQRCRTIGSICDRAIRSFVVDRAPQRFHDARGGRRKSRSASL